MRSGGGEALVVWLWVVYGNEEGCQEQGQEGPRASEDLAKLAIAVLQL
ncbi:MAG: hypothetical protein ACXIU8_10215 [Alkalilacustris sp.]